MFNKNDYERLSESLQTSEEFLFAIEKVSGASLEREDDGSIINNAACQLWEEGGCENEILAALPTEQADEEEEIFWADLKAYFDGEKWSWRIK